MSKNVIGKRTDDDDDKISGLVSKEAGYESEKRIIRNIDNGEHYTVHFGNGKTDVLEVGVDKSTDQKYLRTKANHTTLDNLGNLSEKKIIKCLICR